MASPKISKSNTTPEMEKRDAEYRTSLAMKKCMHFERGTWIMMNNRRGEVLYRVTEVDNHDLRTVLAKHLRVRWEDGSVSLVKPIALNR